jgi:hypothetical protein
MSSKKRYIGDGVYAEYDGYSIWLTTENGIETTNRICLDPEIYDSLTQFVESIKSEQEAK